MVGRPLDALILEDCEDDALLVVRELGQQGFDVTWERAWTAAAMKSFVEAKSWDVVLSDYSMPGFDAPAALLLLQESGQDLPFIVVSGTIGEEAAVAAMKNGAHDYLMKGKLKRLGAAIEREIKDARVRREHRLAIDKIEHLNRVLRAIRNVNQLIVQEKNRERLLERAAQMLIDTRGYTSVWCARLDEGHTPTIAAWSVTAGEPTLATAEELLKTGLTACMQEASRSGRPVMIDDDAPDCGACPLHPAHAGRHRLARALEYDDRSLGMLCIALPEGIRPDAEELDLLEELAKDLGFALHGIEQAERLLEETAMTDAALNAMQDTFFLFNPTTGRALRWNQAFRESSGYADDEIAAMPAPQSYYGSDHLQRTAAAMEMIAREGHAAITLDLVTKDGARIPTEYSATSIPGKDGMSLIISVGRDITERLLAQQRDELSLEVLALLNQAGDGTDRIRGIVSAVNRYMGFEAVGIRLRRGDDFPYYETRGFPEAFVQRENNLCERDAAGEVVRDARGDAVLECMCGNILCGRTNPKLPFFTDGGSFWTSCTTELLATTTEEDRQACTRNRCNGEGYESVALIPLRSDDDIIGLLQINDRRRDQFTPETIRFFEGLGVIIGIALARNEAAEALRREKDFVESIVNTAQTIVLMLDPRGKIVTFNPYMESLSGWSRCEVQGKDWFDTFLPERSRAVTRELFSGAISGTPTRGNVDAIVTRDGRELLIEWYDSTLIDSTSQTTSLLCIGQDVTEREARAEALRNSEIQLSTALQMAKAGHWEYDVASDTFTFNDSFYRVFRTTAAAVGGYQMSSADYGRRFCHPDDAARVGEEVRAAIETTDPSYSRQIEHRILYADGEVGHIAVRFSIVKDPQGRTVRTYGVNQDISDRKRLQAQIAQSDRLANMGMLAAGVAHEINNPLAYVLYNLESLTDDLPKLSSALRKGLDIIVDRVGNDEWSRLMGKDQELLDPMMLDDIRARLEDALEGSQRIKDVARGLGTFSRVERDRMVPVALMHVIEVAINMASNEIKYRARLVKEYGQTSTILANDGRLSQVFLNLLINAAHSITDGDMERNEIRVRTWQEGDEVFAEVRDTGKGISREHLPHLFEPFFTTKEIGVGTGLGLAISKTIVEEYGGRIEVESEVGKGTRFVVRLPAKKAAAEDEAAPDDQVVVQAGVRGRILVVDDEAAIRSAMVRMLRGHDVVQAVSGNEAREILEADQAFDLILCDMMMPLMSGVDLHEWLSTTHPDLAKQVVFITGGAFTPKAREHLSKVSNIRLEKPFDVPNFKKIVAELIVAYRNRGS